MNADGKNDNKTSKYILNFQSYGLVDFVRKYLLLIPIILIFKNWESIARLNIKKFASIGTWCDTGKYQKWFKSHRCFERKH